MSKKQYNLSALEDLKPKEYNLSALDTLKKKDETGVGSVLLPDENTKYTITSQDLPSPSQEAPNFPKGPEVGFKERYVRWGKSFPSITASEANELLKDTRVNQQNNKPSSTLDYIGTEMATSLPAYVAGAIINLNEYGVNLTNPGNPVLISEALKATTRQVKELKRQADNYDPSGLEEAAATGLKFMEELPIFMVGGSVGRSVAKGVLSAAEKIVPKQILGNVAKKYVADALVRSASGASALGSYGFLNTVKDELDENSEVGDINWKQTLLSAGDNAAKDAATGGALGLLGTGAFATKQATSQIKNQALRFMAKQGVNVTEPLAEAGLFTLSNAAMDRGEMGWKEFRKNLEMVITMKVAGGLTSPLSKKSTPDKKVFNSEFSPEEMNAAKKYGEFKDPSFFQGKETELQQFMDDPSIPITAKAKTVFHLHGIKPENFDDKVNRIEKNEDEIRLYNKEGELLTINKYSPEEAETIFDNINMRLYEEAKHTRLSEFNQWDQNQIKSNLGKQEKEIVAAVKIPFDKRTPEQHDLAKKYFDEIDRVDKEIRAQNEKVEKEKEKIEKEKEKIDDRINRVKKEAEEGLTKEEKEEIARLEEKYGKLGNAENELKVKNEPLPEEAKASVIESYVELKGNLEEIPRIVSSNVKSALANNKKKLTVEIDESGKQIVKENDFNKDDAEAELYMLEDLAKKGKLTPKKFQSSYFGQASTTIDLQNSFDYIKKDQLEFINKLKAAFIGGKENAIQERGTEEIPVGKTPGNSQEVGGRIPEPERPTPTQENEPLGENAKAPQEEITLGVGGKDIPVAPSAEPSAMGTWNETITKFKNSTGIPLKYKIKPARKAAGIYRPSSGATGSKEANNVRVLSHESGHFLSDKYGMFNRLNFSSENELLSLSKTGSKPPKNISPQAEHTYKLAEGMAEYMTARVLNPVEAGKLAPNFEKVFNDRLPKEILEAVDALGKDTRSLLSNDRLGQMAINLQVGKKEANRPFFGSKEKFYVSKIDQFTTQYFTPNRIYEKAFNMALRKNGIDPRTVKGTKNFISMMRISAGQDKVAMRAFSDGFIDFHYKPIIDPATGKKLNNDWLDEPIVNMSDKTESSILGVRTAVISVGNAQRVVDFIDRVMPQDQIIKDVKDGLLPDLSIYDKHKGEIGGIEVTKGQTIDEKVQDMISYGMKPQDIKRYDFSDATVLGTTGGFDTVRREYDMAQKELGNFEKLKSQNKQQYDDINEALRRYRMLADENMKSMVASGRKSQEWYDNIKQRNPYYISFQRAYETEPSDVLDFKGTPGTKGKLSVPKEVIHQLRGSSQAQADPYISLWSNVAQFNKEARRNQTMLAFVDAINAGTRNIGDPKWKLMDDIGTRVDKKEPNTIEVFRNGEPEYYRLDKDLYQSFNHLVDSEFAKYGFGKALKIPVSIIEYTVTRDPRFAIKNKVRDIQQYLFYGNSPSITSLFPSKGLINFMEGVGGGQFGLIANKRGFEKAQSEYIKKLSTDKGNLLYYANPKRAWQHYEQLLGRVENSTRAAEFKDTYDKMKKQGYSHEDAVIEAALAARDLLDFSVQGRAIGNVRFMIPFLNPAIQSKRKMYREMINHPAKFAVRFALTQGLAELAQSAMIALSDEETRKRYSAKTDISKALFYQIPIGNGKFITIPKNFEMGALASIMGRLFDRVIWEDKLNVDKGTLKVAMNALNPIDPTLFAGGQNMINELRTGYDGFRQKYVIPPSEQKLAVEQREGTKYASNLGKVLQEAAFNKIDARNADFVITKLLGGAGDLALAVSNIGDERARNKIDITKTGFVKKDSPYTNENVQVIASLAAAYKLTNTKEYRALQDLIGAFYDSKDEVERRDLLIEITREAEILRPLMEEYRKTPEYKASKVDIWNKEPKP